MFERQATYPDREGLVPERLHVVPQRELMKWEAHRRETVDHADHADTWGLPASQHARPRSRTDWVRRVPAVEPLPGLGKFV